jgi:hypothetical protein
MKRGTILSPISAREANFLMKSLPEESLQSKMLQC